MTQKELIQGMKTDLYNEVVYQIEWNNKTIENEKELQKLIRQQRKVFQQLLNTMNIKKEINYTFFSIMTDIAEKAHINSDYHAMRILNMYDMKVATSA